MSQRLPHVVMDLQSRMLKAKKIEALIDCQKENPSLLEVGAGSGGISYYFSVMAKKKYKVYACDLIDNIVVDKQFDFTVVNSTDLPYQNETMDIVVSNHVIEHVGGMDEQIKHLKAIFRVLKKGGLLYIAVPNRWMLVEPHYKLIFLSWLPRHFRSSYLKIMGKGSYYDCEPLEKRELEKLLKQAGFSITNKCAEAMKLTFELERPNTFSSRVLKKVPNHYIKFFTALIPTLIYTAVR